MKEGIFDKIQSIEQQEAPQSTNTQASKRIGLLLILFFALSVSLYFISQKITSDQDAKAHDLLLLPETGINSNASNDIEKAKLASQIDFNGDAWGEKSQQAKVQNRLHTDEAPASNQDLKKPASAQLARGPLRGYPRMEEKNLQNDSIEGDKRGASPSMPNTSQKRLSLLEETSLTYVIPQVSILKALPRDTLDQVSLEKMELSLFDMQKIDRVYPLGIQQATPSNQLILEGGISFWNEGYGSTKPERAQYEIPLSSFQLQGHYMKRLRKNYFIMAGLQYHQLESRFEYNRTLQDYKITLKDTIIQVQNNLLTGEQTIIRGDVERYVQAERRIRHHNTSKLLKASIGIGKSWRFHSFQTDVYLGGALNTLVQNQGRTLNDDTLIDYNGASNSLFQNQLTLDGMLGARLHYFLTQNIGLTTGFQAQKSLMNWSNQENIHFHPSSFSLQLGLSYSL